MLKKIIESNIGSLPDGEPKIASHEKGILLTPLYPDRVGFVCQRAEPRVNEQGAIDVCKAVVAHLNASGERYEMPKPAEGPEAGVDCVSVSPTGQLNFQVTRAMRDPSFWKYLGENKGVMAYREKSELADNLWDAISAKAAKIPVNDRKAITLVLDASDLAAHCSSSALEHFASRYFLRASKLGFNGIWVAMEFIFKVYKLA